MPHDTAFARRDARAEAFEASIRKALTDTQRKLPSDQDIRMTARWIASWRDLQTAFIANAPFGADRPPAVRDVLFAYQAALLELAAKAEDAAIEQVAA